MAEEKKQKELTKEKVLAQEQETQKCAVCGAAIWFCGGAARHAAKTVKTPYPKR